MGTVRLLLDRNDAHIPFERFDVSLAEESLGVYIAMDGSHDKYVGLDWWARMNIKIDKLAKEFWRTVLTCTHQEITNISNRFTRNEL